MIASNMGRKGEKRHGGQRRQTPRQRGSEAKEEGSKLHRKGISRFTCQGPLWAALTPGSRFSALTAHPGVALSWGNMLPKVRDDWMSTPEPAGDGGTVSSRQCRQLTSLIQKLKVSPAAASSHMGTQSMKPGQALQALSLEKEYCLPVATGTLAP